MFILHYRNGKPQEDIPIKAVQMIGCQALPPSGVRCLLALAPTAPLVLFKTGLDVEQLLIPLLAPLPADCSSHLSLCRQLGTIVTTYSVRRTREDLHSFMASKMVCMAFKSSGILSSLFTLACCEMWLLKQITIYDHTAV